MRAFGIFGLILALCLTTVPTSVVQGADAPDSQEGAIGVTPPRLSLTTGEVSFWRPGAEDWSQAQVNTPLAPGDELYTGPQGNLEIQIGSRAFVRGGASTQIGIESHEPDFLQFKVTTGKASFDLRTVEPGRTVEIATPNAAFTIEHAGYYRLDVSGERTSFIARRGGQATVTSTNGQAVAIEPSEDVVIEGNESPHIASYAAPQLDEWDKWNYARTDHVLDAVSARYISPGVYGVDDLDRHGAWRSVPDYGAVWVPRGVASGWAPYTTGRWVHDPYYGWTWVDTAPWGWAPYHYGRWVYVNGFWAWAPGPVVVRPAYSPALVAFLGGPRVGVNVRIGAGPLVGWVALGWGEPCVPWWGPTHLRQRPWWGGWGGPRVVNKTVINRTTVVNVQEINVYRNAEVPNAVVAVSENRFGRGSVTSARVVQADEKSLRPIHTAPQVAATSESFSPREARGIRPPAKVLERSVVATRASRQAKEVPAAGTERRTDPVRVNSPEPRIVSVPKGQETATTPQRPPFGQSRIERRTNDRTQPPAPPNVERQGRRGQASGGAPSVTRQTPQPEPQVTAPSPSPARPQTSGRRPDSDGTRPTPPPNVEGQRRTEQPSAAAPSVSKQAPPSMQREPQASAPSPARPQASVRRPEVGSTRPTAPPNIESQRRSEQPSGGDPPVTRQAPPSMQREPQAAPARPQASSGRTTEEVRQPARALPGEPANRISPDRANTGQQQRERKESPRRSDNYSDKNSDKGGR